MKQKWISLKKKIGDLPIGVKASIGLFFANLITKGISYLTTPIFTRLLTPDEFGKVSVFITWLTVLGYIAMFCLSAGVFNNGLSDYKEDRDTYSFSMLVLSNIITIVFSIAIIFLYPYIKDYLQLDLELIILMCFIYLVQPAYSFWYTRQRYEFRYKNVLIASTLSAFVSQTVAILCLVFMPGDKVYLRILGLEIPLIIFYIIFYFILCYKSKFKIKTKYWKEALLFNLPLIPHYLSTYLLSSSDKIMISHLISDSATAYYSIAHSVASIGIILWSAINGSLLPYTYEKCADKDYKSLNKVTLPLLTIFAFGCFGVILFAPEVVRIMATADYMEAIYVIPPIVGGVFFQVQYYIYANVVYYHKKPVYVMIGSFVAMVLNIGLNYIFIPEFGYIAAGFTTIFCYGLQALIDYFAMRKVVGEKVYSMKYILSLSLIMIIISCFGGILYSYLWLRISLLVLIVVLAIVFRKKILSYIILLKKKNEKESI